LYRFCEGTDLLEVADIASGGDVWSAMSAVTSAVRHEQGVKFKPDVWAGQVGN